MVLVLKSWLVKHTMKNRGSIKKSMKKMQSFHKSRRNYEENLKKGMNIFIIFLIYFLIGIRLVDWLQAFV
jgi:hypothetical protein